MDIWLANRAAGCEQHISDLAELEEKARGLRFRCSFVADVRMAIEKYPHGGALQLSNGNYLAKWCTPPQENAQKSAALAEA